MRSTLITGVSSGLGAELFQELCASGDRIMALGRSFTELQQSAANAEPDRITLRKLDLSDTAAMPTQDEILSFAVGATEVALIHNAAVIEPLGAIGSLPVLDVLSTVSVNLLSPMLLTNSTVAAWLKLRSSESRLTVLFVSSGAAHRVSEGRAVYSTTKRAGEWFFETLAAEYAGDPDVRVANVDPGAMDTAMQATIREHVRRGGYLPGGGRFVELHTRRALPSPAESARRIMARYLHRDTCSAGAR